MVWDQGMISYLLGRNIKPMWSHPKHLEQRVWMWQDHLSTTASSWRWAELSSPNLHKSKVFSQKTTKTLSCLLCKLWDSLTLFLRLTVGYSPWYTAPSPFYFWSRSLALKITRLKSETHCNKMNQNYYWKNKISLTLWLNSPFMAIWKSYSTNSESNLVTLSTHSGANVALCSKRAS